jgi:hypothetical protein
VYRRRKRAWLLAMVAAGFLFGVCTAYFNLPARHNWFAAPLTALYLLLVFGWYHADSDERGFHRGLGMNFFVVALAVIGIPIYLLRTRGFMRGLRGIVLALLMLMAVIAAAVLGVLVVALASGTPVDA